MPLVIRQSADSASAQALAVQRLAASMLNMERGAREYMVGASEVIVRAPGPHPPWPLFSVPPLTTRGQPCQVHYRPACGVVYYSSSIEGVVALAEQLKQLLDEHPRDHLLAARATEMTPTTVLRAVAECNSETVVTGPRRPFRKPLPPGAARAGRPARLLLVAPMDERGAPPQYSVRAVFTWVFLPMSTVFTISKHPTASASNMNALVAGIVFDWARLLSCPDESEPATLTVDLIQGAPEIARWTNVEGRIAAFTGFSKYYALLVTRQPGSTPPAYSIAYVGDYRTLTRQGAAARRARRALTALPHVEWPDGVAGCTKGERRSTCVCCSAPVGGSVVILTSPCCPPLTFHMRSRVEGLRTLVPGGPLAHPDPAAPSSVLICENCWTIIDQPTDTFAALQVEPARVQVPWAQADAAAALGLNDLASLLRSRPTKIAPGAYQVSVLESCGAATRNIILAGASLGPLPAVDYPGKMGEYVVVGVQLIEAV